MPVVGTPDPILRTRLAGLDLATPIVLAAGTAGTLDETADVCDLARVGAVVTKSITPEPREGNDWPRLVPLEVGMLNAIGLANPGIDAFVREYAPRAGTLPCAVIGSAAGFSIDDYVRVAGAMGGLDGLAAVEVNVSCPNVHGGTEFGADPALLRELLAAVRPLVVGRPLIIKLGPVAIGTPTGAVDLARVAVEGGADALTLCNTMPAMAIDVRTRRTLLARGSGGLSGPAVHSVVVKIVHDVYREAASDAGVPILAAGGATGWRSAAEFILAGASAVQVGAGSLASVRTPTKIAGGLAKWARSQGVDSIAALVGAVRTA